MNGISSFHFICRKKNIIIHLKSHWQVLNLDMKQEQGSIDLDLDMDLDLNFSMDLDMDWI